MILNGRCPNCRRPARLRAEGERDYHCPGCGHDWIVTVTDASDHARRMTGDTDLMAARWT